MDSLLIKITGMFLDTFGKGALGRLGSILQSKRGKLIVEYCFSLMNILRAVLLNFDFQEQDQIIFTKTKVQNQQHLM